MKLQFSATQDYQLEAVKSVIDIFEGQPLAKGDFEISFAMEGASIAYTETGIGNNLVWLFWGCGDNYIMRYNHTK